MENKQWVDANGEVIPYKVRYQQRLMIKNYVNMAKIKNMIVAISCIFVVLYTLTVAIAVTNYIDSTNEEMVQLRREAKTLREYRDGYNTLSTEYSQMVSENAAITQENADMKSVIEQTDASLASLKAEVESLRAENKSLTKKYNQAVKDVAIIDKYKYALIDESGNRTDLTLDEMKLGIELMEEKGYDPNILFSIGMVESGYNRTCTNSRSTAKGYHQFLNDTAKFTYETLMNKGKGTWTPGVAFDGKTNIKMCVEYFDYLMKKHGNFYKAIGQYCGKGTAKGSFTYTYINRMDKHASRSGVSIYNIINKM